MTTFAYLRPLAEAALTVAAGFDESTPTPPAGAVIDIADVGELLGDIAADLDNTHDLTYGVDLLDDLRLKWLGVVAMRTVSGDDLEALQYTFANVANDVFGLVLEDAERADDDAIRLAEAERPITLSNLWSHPKTMLLDNAALGFWLRLLSWSADKDTDTVSDHTVRHLGTERVHAEHLHMGDLVTAGLITRQNSGWRLHVRFDDQT